MKVLHLTPRMAMGYGVSEAIAAMAAPLAAQGIGSTIGCLEHDKHFPGLAMHRVRPNPEAVTALAKKCRAQVVVAHGSPFFEVLPDLTWIDTVAFEYGDPTPQMFDHDADERARIVEHKRRAVYPKVKSVIAISEFIRHDIDWPDSYVVRLGCDHVPDLGTKPLGPPRKPGPLRVGVLMRLGPGEAAYKGRQELLDLAARSADRGLDIQFELMGRGTPQDAGEYQAAGFTTHLNATDEQRTDFLRQVDVFVSPSQWEGTNLPLVEAQALGTPGLAFDTGAHPEFTPLVMPSIQAMADQLEVYSRRPDLVAEHGRMAYRFVRSTMRWQTAGYEVAAILRGTVRPIDTYPAWARLRGSRIARARGLMRARGIRGTAVVLADKLSGSNR